MATLNSKLSTLNSKEGPKARSSLVFILPALVRVRIDVLVPVLSALVRVRVLIVFHNTLVGTRYALHLLTVAVVAGNLDGSVSQFVLQVNIGREDDAATANQGGLYLVHVGDALGAQSESHTAQAGDGYAVAFGGPSLDYLASCIPAGLHHSFAHSAA